MWIPIHKQPFDELNTARRIYIENIGKDGKYLLTLSRDNYEDWFRCVKVKVKSKGVYYIIETSRIEYAWV